MRPVPPTASHKMPPETSYHEPVLLAETLRFLAPKSGETILDATLGGGGHSERIAAAIAPGGTLIGLDRDPDALSAAEVRLAAWRDHLSIIHIRTDFGNMRAALDANPATQGRKFDGALFDLGVSSHQLDTPRGFSFRRDEPLDMRMDATSGPTAADLIASSSEIEIARILREYGEERWAARIARNLRLRQQSAEPVRTTAQLAAVVESSIPRAAWPRDIHVATRTFQALRIAVNAELEQLEAGLDAVMTRLAPGGRIVVISYHSLEDRIVKRMFAAWAGRAPSAPGSSPAAFLPTAPATPFAMRLLTTKPTVPSEEEIARNPRARSAKLRAILRQPDT